MKICVFCGSKTGQSQALVDEVRALGRFMSEQGHELVYGGARVGLMGVIADAVMQSGGRVIGILPRFLSDVEVAKDDVTELVYVSGMDERKKLLILKADLFITLPGGFGSMDELFEALTLRQLDMHDKANLVMNFQGYYDGLKTQVATMVDQGFVSPELGALCEFVPDFQSLRERITYFAKRKI